MKRWMVVVQYEGEWFVIGYSLSLVDAEILANRTEGKVAIVLEK